MIEDDPIFGGMVSRALAATHNVVHACTLELALERLRREPRPDVIVVDLIPAGANRVVDVAGALGVACVVISDRIEPRLCLQLFSRGVPYLTKPIGSEDVVDAVGIAACPRMRTGILEQASAHARLSQRQQQVLRMAASGLTAKEIANQLNTSTRTIETYVRRACQKLGVRSLPAAVAVVFAAAGSSTQTSVMRRAVTRAKDRPPQTREEGEGR